MSWDVVFAATNLLAVAGWLALALLPRKERVLEAVLLGAVGMLCLAYAALFVVLFAELADPVRASAAPLPPFEYTIDGIMTMLASRGATVLAWTHYLAFDLFVGLWLARDADTRGVHRLVQLPFLFATFMAGPIGMLGWLATRRFLARR